MLTRPPPAPRTRTTGPGAARRPRPALRRPYPLACLVLEADIGAQVASGAFICGHTPGLPHRDRVLVALERLPDRDLAGPAMAVHQLPPPFGGVPDAEQPADQRLDPAQSPPLVPANPCASGPLRKSSSSRAHCCGLSFSRDTGPLDRSASAPPSRQARATAAPTPR
jgi:hypothetical protein